MASHIGRRKFLATLGGAAAWPLAGRAQQPAIPMIGYLDSRSPEAVANRLRGFRQGLKESGYVENENLAIAYRWAENQPDRLQDLATDLARRRVAAIVSAGPPATFAANAAAPTMGLQIQVLNADNNAEIGAAFEAIGRDRPDAIFVATTPFLNGRRVQLTQLAAFHRLPAIYSVRDCAEVGGLMSYGSDLVDGYRQIGVYTGRILKGAMPSDLPVVQSTKFELVVNLSTAKMLGFSVPDKLLVAADEVIE